MRQSIGCTLSLARNGATRTSRRRPRSPLGRPTTNTAHGHEDRIRLAVGLYNGTKQRALLKTISQASERRIRGPRLRNPATDVRRATRH